MNTETESGRAKLNQLAGQCRSIVAERQHVLKDADSGAKVIFSGWCVSMRYLENGARQIMDVLLTGDLVGLDTLNGRRSPNTVLAVTRSIVGTINPELFNALIKDPDVARFVMLYREVEAQRLTDTLAATGCLNAQARIADFLIRLHARLQSVQLADERSFMLPLSQEDVGDHLGLTVVHVNRTLRYLREEGVLSWQRHLVVIEDLNRLSRVAAGRHSPPLSHGTGAARAAREWA
jgi:CRP-like cAMP-binding protein